MVLEQSLSGRPRERAKAHAKATLPHVCAMCGYAIDMTADPFRDPLACAVDEWYPRDRGGSGVDHTNLTLQHRWCNGSKGKRWPVTQEMRERCRTHITQLLAAKQPTIRTW